MGIENPEYLLSVEEFGHRLHSWRKNFLGELSIANYNPNSFNKNPYSRFAKDCEGILNRLSTNCLNDDAQDVKTLGGIVERIKNENLNPEEKSFIIQHLSRVLDGVNRYFAVTEVPAETQQEP